MENLHLKYIALIKEAKSGDIEAMHCKHDDIICALLHELGYDDVVAEYDKYDKWYA